MRTPQFESDTLLPLFRRRRIVTMPEMKAALGTTVDRTVLRKLQDFPYHCSYSHRGKFYTLDPLAEFDDRGLWAYQGARFSRFGGRRRSSSFPEACASASKSRTASSAAISARTSARVSAGRTLARSARTASPIRETS